MGSPRFDISRFAKSLDPSLSAGPRNIETVTQEILDLKQDAGNTILTIGRRLIEAKEMLPHGEWLPWLTERVEFSERTAQDFMRLAREWSNPQTFADLGPGKALAILALPKDEREQFIAESHDVDGEKKRVAEMSVRDLKKEVKSKKERARREPRPRTVPAPAIWGPLTPANWPDEGQLVVLSRENAIGGVEYQLARCVGEPESTYPFIDPNSDLICAELLRFDRWVALEEDSRFHT